jgi:hypothetical protein
MLRPVCTTENPAMTERLPPRAVALLPLLLFLLIFLGSGIY